MAKWKYICLECLMKDPAMMDQVKKSVGGMIGGKQFNITGKPDATKDDDHILICMPWNKRTGLITDYAQRTCAKCNQPVALDQKNLSVTEKSMA